MNDDSTGVEEEEKETATASCAHYVNSFEVFISLSHLPRNVVSLPTLPTLTPSVLP